METEGPRNPFAKPRADSAERGFARQSAEQYGSGGMEPRRMTPNKFQDAIRLKELQDSNQELSSSKLSKNNLEAIQPANTLQEYHYSKQNHLFMQPNQPRPDQSLYPPKPPSKGVPSGLSLQQAITKLMGPPAIIRDQRPSAPIPISSDLYQRPSASGFIFQPVNTQSQNFQPYARNEARVVLNRTHGYIDSEGRRFPSREPPTVLLGDGEIDLYLKTGIIPRRDRSAPNFRSSSFNLNEAKQLEVQSRQNSPQYLIGHQPNQINQISTSTTYRTLEPRSNIAPPTQMQRISFAVTNNQNLTPYSPIQTSQRGNHQSDQGLRSSLTVPSGLLARPSIGNPFSMIDQERTSLNVQTRTPNFSTLNFESVPQQRVSNTTHSPVSRIIRYETNPGENLSTNPQVQQVGTTQVISTEQNPQTSLRRVSQTDQRYTNVQGVTNYGVSQLPQGVPQTSNLGSRVNIIPKVLEGQNQRIQFIDSTRRMSTPTVIQITSDPKDRLTQGLLKQPKAPQPTSPPNGLAQVLAKINTPTPKPNSQPPNPSVAPTAPVQPARKDPVAFGSMFLSDPSNQPPQSVSTVPVLPAQAGSRDPSNVPNAQEASAAGQQPENSVQVASQPAGNDGQTAGVVIGGQPLPVLKDSSLWEGRSEKTDQYQLVEERPNPAPELSLWATKAVVIEPKNLRKAVKQAENGSNIAMSQGSLIKPADQKPFFSIQHLKPLEIAPPRSTHKPNFFLGGNERPQVTGYPGTPAQIPREGSWAFSAQRGSAAGGLSDESQLAKVLDHLYSGQGIILQQLGNLAVGNPWVVLKELELRTEKEKLRLEQILLEKERMEGLIEGLREQLREERSKFQLKRASQIKEGRNEQVSTNDYRNPPDKVGTPSYSKSQIVQGNKPIVEIKAPSHAHIGGDPMHEFASMMNSQIVGHEEQQGYAMESLKGDRTSVRSKGLSGSKITYNPPSLTAAQRNIPKEVIESQAVNSGTFVPYYWQGNTVNENVPVLFDIRPDVSMNKSNLTGEGDRDNNYLGKKIVSRFATIVPGQGTPNANNDELARLKEMNERLAEENRQLQLLLKVRSPESEQVHPVQKDTDRTNSEESQTPQQNYRRLDYFGARPSIQTKFGAGFTNINLAIPDLRATQYSGKAAGELSPVIETDQDGVRQSGPPEAEHLKETQLQLLQNYLSPVGEQPDSTQTPQNQQNQQETNPTRGYNSIFSFHPSMEMISALTQYVNNPNMTAEQSGIKGLPLVQSKAFGFDSHMPTEGGRASVATGYFGGPQVSAPAPNAATVQLLSSQIADTTTGLKGSHTEPQMSASNVDANLDRSNSGEKPILVGLNATVVRRSGHQKKRNLSDVGRTNEDGAPRITEVAEHEEGLANTDRELEEELKKKDEEIQLLRTIIGTLAQDSTETPEKVTDTGNLVHTLPERTSSQLMAVLNEAIDHHFGRNSQASNQRPSQHTIQRTSLGSTSVKSNNLVPPLHLGHYLLKTSNVLPARHETPAILEESHSIQQDQKVEATPVQDPEEYRKSAKVQDDSFGQHESPVRDFSGFSTQNMSHTKTGPVQARKEELKQSTELNRRSVLQREDDMPVKHLNHNKNFELADPSEFKEADIYSRVGVLRAPANYSSYGTDQEESDY